MAPNCFGKRSFSRLKRIKNDLRSTVFQDCLSDLNILYTGNDKVRLTDFNDIDKFVPTKKAQKESL